MNAKTYYGLYKIAADEESWWDKNQHKVWQAAIPGIGTYAISRLFGADPAVSAALGLGAGAVGWHSGDWAKDWFKKDNPTTPASGSDFVSDYYKNNPEQLAAEQRLQEQAIAQAVKEEQEEAKLTKQHMKDFAYQQKPIADEEAARQVQQQLIDAEEARQVQQLNDVHEYRQQLIDAEKARQAQHQRIDAEEARQMQLYDELAYGDMPTAPATATAGYPHRRGGTSASSPIPTLDQVRLVASLAMAKYKMSAGAAWKYATSVVARGGAAVKEVMDNFFSRMPNTPPARPANKNSKFFNVTR